MTPENSITENRVDQFLDELAAFDEALAANDHVATLSLSLNAKSDEELVKAQECLRLLEKVWPRRTSRSSNNTTTGFNGNRSGSPTRLSIPDRLGRFRIIREIGRGGCGVVFLGHDPVLNRDVAVKVPLLRGLLSPESQQRFLNEAQVAARLDHSNIIPIYESGVEDGVYYIASAYCPGVDLGRWHKAQQNAVPVRDAAQLVAELADAIHHAHHKGVLHRDLKPANIILQISNCKLQIDDNSTGGDSAHNNSQSAFCNLNSAIPKITDFGLAKIVEGDGAELVQTQSGAVLGTPQYMAPEQAEGRLGDIDRATDVYGLGAILYELLAGRPPFQGASPLEVLSKVTCQEPVAPRNLRADVPRDLETICLKCLRKRAEERYASAREMAQELRRYLNGEPIRAHPISRLERIARWCGKHRALASMIAVTSAAMLLLVIGGLLFKNANDRRIEAERYGRVKADLADTESKLRKEAEKGRTLAQNLATTQKVFALTEAAEKEIASKKKGWTWRGLDKLEKAAALDTSLRDMKTLRTAAVRFMAGVDIRETGVLHENFVASQVAFSPDGKYLAMGEHKTLINLVFPATVLLMDMRTKKIVKRLQFPTHAAKAGWSDRDGCRSLCFSPDGKWLCVGSRSGWIHCWDRAKSTTTPTHSWQAAETEILNLIASPDGNSLYSKDHEGSICRWKLGRKGEQLRQYPAYHHTPAMSLSPDGSTLATHAAKIDILDSVTLQLLTANGEYQPNVLCFHPASPLLALGQYSGRIILLSSSTGEQLGEFFDPSAGNSKATTGFMQFNSDGSLLLSGAAPVNDRHVRIWHTASGQLLARIQPGDFGPLHAAFHPSGRSFVIASDKKIVQYEIGGNDEQKVLAHQSNPLLSLAWSPNGKWLACYAAAGDDQQCDITLWDATNGDLLGRRTIAATGNTVIRRGLAFHPTKNLLAAGGKKGVLLWSFGSDWENGDLPTDRAVGKLRFGANGAKLWGLVWPDHVRSWDCQTGKTTSKWENTFTDLIGNSPVLHALDVCDEWVLAGGEDDKMYVLNARDGKHKQTWSGVQAPLTSAACNQSGSLAAYGTSTGRVLVRRIPNGEIVADFDDHDDFVAEVAFSADGRLLATASRDATLRLYKCSGNDVRHLLTLHSNSGPFNGAAFHPDGRRLATIAQNDNAVRIWHLDKICTRLTSLKIANDWPAFTKHVAPERTETWTAQLAADRGRELFVNGRPKLALLWFAKALRLTDAKPNKLRERIETLLKKSYYRATLVREHKPFDVSGQCADVNFSPNGKLLLACGGHRKHTANLFDVESGQPFGQPLVHQRHVRRACFSPDGKTILTVTWQDKAAHLWETSSGKRLCDPLPHPNPIMSCCFRPDGKVILTGTGLDDSAFLWDTKTFKMIDLKLYATGKYGVSDIVYSPDGKLLGLGSSEGFFLWNLDKPNAPPRKFSNNRWAYRVAFSPDGKLVAVSDNPAARVWDTTTHKLAVPPLIHDALIWDVAFDATGKLIATAGDDGTLRIWETANGREFAFPLKHPKRVTCVTFHPTRPMFATGCQDGTARLWQLPPRLHGNTDQVIEQIERHCGMRLTEQGHIQLLK